MTSMSGDKMTNISEHINKYFADRLTPENAALLLVDHQTGLALGVATMNPEAFPGRYGGHKTIQNNRALEAAFKRAGLIDVSSHNMRKTFATRLLSRGAAITDVQHLLGHASVKTTEKAYAAFVKNERFKQTIDLLDTPTQPILKIVK
jgi:integrase